MPPATSLGRASRPLAAAGPVLLPAGLFLLAALNVPAVAGTTTIDAGMFGALAGALAILLVGAATSTRSRWLRPGLGLAAALGLCAHALLLGQPGVPLGHDTYHHLWGLFAYGSELQDGNWVPLWLHRLGLGMPLPAFYAPLVFWTATPLLLLGAGPGLTLKVLLLGAGAGAAATAFWVARRLTGDAAAALVVAAAVAFAPYRLLDAHYRVALAETAGFALLPLVLYFSSRFVRDGGGRRLAAAAAAAALLAATHILTALTVALVAGPCWLLSMSIGPSGSLASRWRSLGRLAALGGLAALLAACFLLPLMAALPATSAGGSVQAPDDRYSDAGLELGDLSVRQSWERLLLTPGVGVDQSMPMYFGSALLALLLAAGVRALAAKSGPTAAARESPAPWVAMAVLALLLTLGPVARITAWMPLLESLQFPWRFLAVATTAAALAGGFAAAWLSEALAPRWRRWVPAAITAIVVADAQPMTGAALWLPAYEGFGMLRFADDVTAPHLQFEAVDMVPTMRVAGAFLPPEGRGGGVDVGVVGAYPEWQTEAVRKRTIGPAIDAVALARASVGLWLPAGAGEPTVLQPTPYATWQRRAPPGAALRACQFERGAGRIRVDSPGREGLLLVREQCFPGWQVRTAAGWRPAACADDGTLQAEVRDGETWVEFRFQRWTAARTAGWLASAAGLIAALSLWRRGSG